MFCLVCVEYALVVGFACGYVAEVRGAGFVLLGWVLVGFNGFLSCVGDFVCGLAVVLVVCGY